MDESGNGSFFAELKRRKVVRVAVAYVGVALGVLEVADITFAALFLDDRLKGFLVLGAAGGLPVVLVLAWLYDLTSRGIERTPDVESPDGPPRRFSRQLVIAAAVVIALMSAAGWRYMPNDRVELTSNQISVLPFENRTGEAELDPWGLMVADHVVNGLTRMDGFNTLALNPGIANQVAAAGEASGGNGATSLVGIVAERTGSRLVITGSYFLTGNDVTFQATVHDALRDEIAFASDPVRASRTDPIADFDRLRDDLSGYLGLLGTRVEQTAEASRRITGRAPTYAAYKEFALGLRAFGVADYRTAATQYELAASLDSTFFGALWRGSTARMNMGDWAGTERLVERMEAMRSELQPEQLDFMEWARGNVDGDLRLTHDAAVRISTRNPISSLQYLSGIATQQLNRPEEAIEHFRKYDLKWGGGWPFIWTSFAAAHHRLGRHRTELRLIRRGREALPENPYVLAAELKALAARGRGDEVEGRIDELGPLDLRLEVAEELDAHDDPEAARRVVAGVLSSLEALPAEEQRLYSRSLLRVAALAALDQGDEARELVEALLPDAPEDESYLVWSGILAARAGDSEHAAEAIARLGALDVPYQRGSNVFAQARVAGALGDADRAVHYLETAFEQGAGRFMTLHVDPAFRDIRDEPAFQAFEAPKG